MTTNKSYPFKNIGIETTSACNSKCLVCVREEHYKQPVITMSMDLFKKIIIDIHDNHLEEITRFSGMGDPSCDPLLMERLRFCKERAPDLKIGIQTNMAIWGNSFTDAVVEEQLLKHIRFSVLAVTENASKRVYGNPAQAVEARKSIEYFIEKNNNAGHPVQTMIYTLMLEDDDGELDRIKYTYWDLADEFEVWRPHTWSDRMPSLRALQQERRICPQINNFSACIRVNGDLCACSLDINHEIVYGNLQQQSLMEICESSRYKELKELNLAGRIESLPSCLNCTYLNASQDDVLVELKAGTKDRRV